MLSWTWALTAWTYVEDATPVVTGRINQHQQTTGNLSVPQGEGEGCGLQPLVTNDNLGSPHASSPPPRNPAGGRSLPRPRGPTLFFLRAFPHYARLFTPRHFISQGIYWDTLLHEITGDDPDDSDRETEPERGIARVTAIFTDLISCKGVNIHCQNYFDDTPLMNTMSASNYAFANLLLDKDPSGINLRDEEGRTALNRAIEAGFEAGVALLLEQPASEVISSEAFFGGAELLIKSPTTDLSHQDEWDDTALILAAQGVQTDLVRLMPEKPGAVVDVNAEDNNGHTALYLHWPGTTMRSLICFSQRTSLTLATWIWRAGELCIGPLMPTG
ncbi:ankyrin repeat-containing domain protein [Aspergillus fruticulosus]